MFFQPFWKAIKYHALKIHFQVPAMLIKLCVWPQQCTESIKLSSRVGYLGPQMYYKKKKKKNQYGPKQDWSEKQDTKTEVIYSRLARMA